MIPQLPETRYGLGSFVTPTELEKLAVCGGWWEGKPNSTDCLTLNTTNGQWERGTFTNGLLGEGVRGVIIMEDHGVYVVHSRVTSFLAQGSDTWSAGPVFPTSVMSSAECACNLTKSSFVTIHTNEGHNVREYSTTDQDWKSETLWPSTAIKRWSPGCGATLYHLVIAGGVSGWDEVLASVEVFVIESKALLRGGNMKHARAFFNIMPVGTSQLRLLAIGGRDGLSTLKSSEWWEEEDNVWGEGFSLSMGRSSYGVVLAPAYLACTEVEPPYHSCPADNGSQSCYFPLKAADVAEVAEGDHLILRCGSTSTYPCKSVGWCVGHTFRLSQQLSLNTSCQQMLQRPSVRLSVTPSVCHSVCLSLCPSVTLSVRLATFLCIWVSEIRSQIGSVELKL